MNRHFAFFAGFLFVLVFSASSEAQEKKKGDPNVPSPTEKELLAGIKVPAGFHVSIFGGPPDVNYPTCLACAPTGEVFVGIDQNGSLDAKPERGFVLRCVDVDGDGKMDKYTTFCKVDSPRGLIVDRNAVYVLHPPHLSVHYDDDGDGVADRSEILVKNIGFDLKFRGADHTTNGIRMGIDGWIYVAVGDYGFVKAEGKDGKQVQLRGGGVARVRPDGSDLEVVALGLRNIYDVAIDPLLNLFTRDNTNDGDGWNVRLSHILPSAVYGYPSLYKKFGDEMIQPMADYGGGSPCGSLYMDEPGFPDDLGRALYTCDWGRSTVYRHPLKAKGASFEADQKVFVEIPRPTDMDVDGSGRIYISSWRNGSFTFAGPNIGFVARVTPPGDATPFPDLNKASDADLVKYHASASHVRRLATQREMLRRGGNNVFRKGLEEIAASAKVGLPTQVAAIFTYKQMFGAKSVGFLTTLLKEPTLREHALRAMVDRVGEAKDVPTKTLVDALDDPNARVRFAATWVLGRLERKDSADALALRLGDADISTAHIAYRVLVALKASEACFKAFDSGRSDVQFGCMLVLQSLHETVVVDGVLARLEKSKDRASRQLLIRALCRLHFREAEWTGQWWGTRPDWHGPYFKHTPWAESEKISAALKKTLLAAETDELPTVLFELNRHKVQIPEALPKLIALAEKDKEFRGTALDLLANTPNLPIEAAKVLEAVAINPMEPAAQRAKALRALHKASSQPALLESAARSFAQTIGQTKPAEVASAWEDFTRDAKHNKDLAFFVKSASASAEPTRVLAYTVLLHLEAAKQSSKDAKVKASRAIEQAWAKPESASSLLKAIGLARADQYAFQVRTKMQDANDEVKTAANATAKVLELDREDKSGKRLVLAKVAYETALADAIKEKGDPKKGAQVFLKQGCIACHTVTPGEPVKGPYLGDIANRYKRPDLIESILKPNAKIAQGFETQYFQMASGKIFEGFIVRESGDEVEIRNVQGVSLVLAKKDIDERGRREISVMPQGLADNLTIQELASLLAYLESLNAAQMK